MSEKSSSRLLVIGTASALATVVAIVAKQANVALSLLSDFP
jgi:hypothetical protein